jgi:hypothetical protein
MNLGAERPVGFHVLARSEFFLEFLAGDLTISKDLCKKTTADRLSTVNRDDGAAAVGMALRGEANSTTRRRKMLHPGLKRRPVSWSSIRGRGT